MSDRAVRKEGVPGLVQAFDVRTGKPRWTFNPIPRPGQVGSETWEDDAWSYSGNANLWSLISADEELGLAYLPLTAPTSDMYGGHRLGDNVFGNTLVCVRCLTGERAWHYQVVHHDLWDYDLPAAPMLVDIRVDGKPIKAVVQLTKQAFAFVLDRATGRPVWPIEERPVPASDVPGERTARTQPFPTKPPAFDRQGVSVDDLIDFTPELRAEAIDLLKNYRIGPLFTPPSVRGDGPGANRGTIQLPGSVGGADWQSGAFDPETGMLYVQSITGPFTADIIKGDPKIVELELRLRHARLDRRTPGPALVQAAVWPHHRHRSEQRRSGVDGAKRRGPQRSPAAEAAEPPVAGKSRAQCAARDEDAALSRGGRPDHVVARVATETRDAGVSGARRGRQEVSRVQQGDRRDVVGDGAARRHDRRPDDVHVRGEAVRDRGDWEQGTWRAPGSSRCASLRR